MIITKEFNNPKEIKESIEKWLKEKMYRKENQHDYSVGDGYTNSEAHCRKKDRCYEIRTAFSGFYYTVEIENDKAKITYDGAFNGLGAQEILPEALQNLDWTGAEVESSLGEYTWEEYLKLREEEYKIEDRFFQLYGDKGTGQLDGIEVTDEQIQAVFDEFKGWDWDWEPGEYSSKDYIWSFIRFEIIKDDYNVVTRFGFWRREKKNGKMYKPKWNRPDKVRKAVETIRRINKQDLKLPEPMVASYQEKINNSDPRLAELFYELVAEKCPDLLRYWAERKGGE